MSEGSDCPNVLYTKISVKAKLTQFSILFKILQILMTKRYENVRIEIISSKNRGMSGEFSESS